MVSGDQTKICFDVDMIYNSRMGIKVNLCLLNYYSVKSEDKRREC